MLKNSYEDHVEKCSKEKGTCKTCELDMTVLDSWNDMHRGSTVLSQNHGKTVRTIIDENGWVTDKDNGDFFFSHFDKCNLVAVNCKKKKEKVNIIFSLYFSYARTVDN